MVVVRENSLLLCLKVETRLDQLLSWCEFQRREGKEKDTGSCLEDFTRMGPCSVRNAQPLRGDLHRVKGTWSLSRNS